MDRINSLINKLYKSINYKIIDYDNRSNLCLLIFSSNGLYSPNNYEQLLYVLTNDKYEFDKILINKKISKKFKRIIFVRDIKRHFYINGISEQHNTFEKVFELLRHLTRGFNVYSLGNSSGGFMAILAAYHLPNVVRVYSAGGVVDPLNWHGPHFDYSFSEQDYVRKLDANQRKILHLDSFLKSCNIPIYSFYSSKSNADKQLVCFLNRLNNPNIKIVLLTTNNHGDYIWSYDYVYVLIKSDKKINKLFEKCKRPLSKIGFSIKNQHVFSLILNYYSYKKLHNR